VGSYGIFRQYKLQKQIKSLNAELTKLRDADTSLDSFNTDNDGLTGGLN
jgi:cell division protein FtsB